MAKVARAGKTDIVVREKALEVTRYIKAKDWGGQVHALFEFVRDNIRYTRDVFGVETIQIPRVTLETQQGDCDDKCTLLAAMLQSVGHPARFVALGFKNNSYSHVIVQTPLKGWGRQKGSWVSLDATEPVKVGWEPPNVTARMIENV